MAAVNRIPAARREMSAARRIPYTAHVSECVVKTHAGDYVKVSTTREQADLEQALRGTLALDPQARRLSRLIEFTDPTRPDGIHARLAQWCYSTDGEYAWAFDNPSDSVVQQLARHATIGFDVTHFLTHELIRGPLNRYLFHLVEQLLDGRKLVCWVDEFSNALADIDFL